MYIVRKKSATLCLRRKPADCAFSFSTQDTHAFHEWVNGARAILGLIMDTRGDGRLHTRHPSSFSSVHCCGFEADL